MVRRDHRRCAAALALWSIILAGCSAAPAVQTGAAQAPASTSQPASAASGAGTGNGSGSGTGTGSACALATAADVTSAYGESFDAGQLSSPGGLSSCLFKQSGGGVDTVNVTLAAGSQADLTYSTNRTAYDATDLSGIGDKAFVSSDGGMIGAEKGSATVLIHLVGFEKDNPTQLQSKQKALLQVCLTHTT